MTSIQPIAQHAPTRPMDILPNIGQVARGHVTICSIYPAPLRARRRHNGITIYEMAAAPRGSYVTYTVYDTQEFIMRPDPTEGKHQLLPMPIPARIIAEDLTASWAGDTLGARSGFRPGIAMIAGDEPTAVELKAMRDSQDSLFDWYIKDGHAKHVKEPHEITDIHRLAAHEMLGDACESLEWYPKTKFQAVKRCPSCAKQILHDALRCEHCTEKLPQFYLDMEMDDPTDDPVVLAAIQRIRAKRNIKDPRVTGQPKQ